MFKCLLKFNNMNSRHIASSRPTISLPIFAHTELIIQFKRKPTSAAQFLYEVPSIPKLSTVEYSYIYVQPQGSVSQRPLASPPPPPITQIAPVHQTRNMKLQSANIFAIITGASRGFGVHIVHQFLSQVLLHNPASLTLMLTSSPSSQALLSDLKADILSTNTDTATKLSIHTIGLDLEKATIETAKSAVTPPPNVPTPDIAFLFSNAAIMQSGRTDSGLAAGPEGFLAQSLAVNTVAVCTMIGAFLQTFDSTVARYLSYTSTIASVTPFASWPAYCTSKAATEMLHKVVVAEHPDVRALLYSPGLMDTHMGKVIVEDENTDPAIVNIFENLRETGTFVDQDMSAGKMVTILLTDEFKNCQHIDVSE